MRIGFLSNQIDNRGTGNAMFDYAHYNEILLGNESRIYTFPYGNHDKLAVTRYEQRFVNIFNAWEIPDHKLDVLYHIKSGFDDNFRSPDGVRYAVHAVFDYQPHGDRYATVSAWLAGVHSGEYVPHIVNLPSSKDSLRPYLGLGPEAIIFGRYGGTDTFDVPFVWEAIREVVGSNQNIHFLFMNTDMPRWAIEHPRIHSAEPTADAWQKRLFINTTDAMLHARVRGETFGIACGEFARCGKPIITYRDSYEQAHFTELPYAEKYSTQEELVDILLGFKPYFVEGYKEHTPEIVMKKFKQVFLD